jgi:hypothetical protein
MAELLRSAPNKNGEETELNRLARITAKLSGKSSNQDLREASECIAAFEACFALVSLAFERLLWLCRHHAAAALSFDALGSDSVLRFTVKSLPASVREMRKTIRNGTHPEFCLGLECLADVERFLEEASAAKEVEGFVHSLIARHTDVQHGKFDKGRRKMPWVEVNGTRINLTMTRIGGMNREATKLEHIAPHPYRLGAADALIHAGSRSSL